MGGDAIDPAGWFRRVDGVDLNALAKLRVSPSEYMLWREFDPPCVASAAIDRAGTGRDAGLAGIAQLVVVGALEPCTAQTVAGGAGGAAAVRAAAPVPSAAPQVASARVVADEDRHRAQVREAARLADRARLRATMATLVGDRDQGTDDRERRLAAASAADSRLTDSGVFRLAEVAAPPPPSYPVITAAEDDPRLDSALSSSVELQRRVLGLADRGREPTDPFAVLGLAPTPDEGPIRDAHRELSRQLHPDRHFKRVPDVVLKQLSDAYESVTRAWTLLRDPAARTRYVDHWRRAQAEHAAAVAKLRAEIEQAAQASLAARQQLEDEARARARSQIEETTARLAEGILERDEERRRRDEARNELRRRREHEDAMRPIRERAAAMLHDAELAAATGETAKAANLAKLASELDPNNPRAGELYQAALQAARKERARRAFERALAMDGAGENPDRATMLFREAAEADPTAVHLAFAAQHVASSDPAAAHAFAMRAVSQLAGDADTPTHERARLHARLAVAFHRLGQRGTARAQLKTARELGRADAMTANLLKLEPIE